MEQGKDVIATDKHGTHYAYQLKSENIDLSNWRRTIRGEVEELVELPIQHPNIPQAAKFRPVLVTNGAITDPVRREITDRQGGWKRNGHTPLELITKWQLLEMFVKAQGTFLPRTPADFELFLRILLRDKREPLHKEDFAAFLENLLPLAAEVKRTELRRTFSATALLASYALSGPQRAGNNFALSEGWMLVIAHLLRLAEKVRSYEPVWLPSIELCIQAWEQSVEALVKESLERKSWVEGNPFVDGDTVNFRTALVLGQLAAFALYKRAKNTILDYENEIFSRISKSLNQGRLWGESAVTSYYAVMVLLWLRGQEGMAVQIAAEIIHLITKINSGEVAPGFPDPYYGPDILLRGMFMREDIFGPKQGFLGVSYSLRSLVAFLCRRERKQLLRSLWYDITAVMSNEFVPDTISDLYLWRAKTGTLVTSPFGQPEQWQTLVESSTRKPPLDLLLTKRFPELLFPFLLVYPHRFTPDLSGLAEASVTQ